MNKTIRSILETQSRNHPDLMAVLGLDQRPSTYRELLHQAQLTQNHLISMGIGRNEPVAIVLPNGPLMAAAFLSIASGFASAPLNPSYSAREFEFYLTDLSARAVVIDAESNSPVIEVAQQLKIPLIHIASISDGGAGLFSIAGEENLKTDLVPVDVKPSDIGLILHTSGTTSRPKMVPLTQKNLCTSAENIRQTLHLTSEDRCLNVMPLFHIHGLMAAVLATIIAGGSIVCTPGFYAPRFFEWMDRYQPTWYTAVPTMHQAILSRAHDHQDIINRSPIRFIRSSSASLAPNVMTNIEAVFDVPVIEAYGMTEAAHQMASNPLPPAIRKLGSVGQPAGPEIGIMHEEQPSLLPTGTLGEIVIRGDNVTLGYLNNPQANTKSFAKGWFRTGDQGYLDDQGYLFLTGRLKEIINRGGEKISPREVDEVLLQHPDVIQAVTFGYPDPVLGENVAAAVICLNDKITTIDLKRFASAQLAQHKIPEIIFFLEEIPKGPTGKLQRIGLAEKLGFDLVHTKQPARNPSPIEPATIIEKKVAAVWKKTLNLKVIGLYDQFREVGGDSMLATLIHQELEVVFGISIPLVDLFAAVTVFDHSKLIEKLMR